MLLDGCRQVMDDSALPCRWVNSAHCLLQDEPNWHRADTDKYESEGEGELYEFGQESLDRIALALGGNTVAPLASSLLPTLLQDADWKKRHAALICISQIAEGCVKVLVKNVHGLADMCIQVCHARNL